MQVVLFLEERSAKALLDGFLPRILPAHISFRCIPFEGKQDLDRQIERRLRGWIAPNTAFLILRDQESADCRLLKQSLLEKSSNANRPETIVRIACRELESWYFGDLKAVEEALHLSGLQKLANKSQYRTPDAIINPASELDKITKGLYQKNSGSRAIGRILTPDRNTSRSFQVFIDGIYKAIEQLPN
jgi:hypothetical protein